MIEQTLEVVTLAIEIVGICAIVIGAVVSLAVYILDLGRDESHDLRFHRLRANLGRSILLGLEFLVAADIITTVAITPTLESVLILAGIVLIRTFLSFALQVEVDGKLPWHRATPAAK